MDFCGITPPENATSDTCRMVVGSRRKRNLRRAIANFGISAIEPRTYSRCFSSRTASSPIPSPAREQFFVQHLTSSFAGLALPLIEPDFTGSKRDADPDLAGRGCAKKLAQLVHRVEPPSSDLALKRSLIEPGQAAHHPMRG